MLITLSFIIVIPQFANEFEQLLTQIPSAAKGAWELSIKSLNNLPFFEYSKDGQGLMANGLFSQTIYNFPDGSTFASGIADSIKKLVNFASNLGIGIVQFIFILTVSVMITVQPYEYKELAIILVPSFYRRRARVILSNCGEALSNWMSGVLISSTCVALMAGLVLYLLGVKLVIANALLAGALNIIPNIGPTISTIFPMSVAFLDAPWKSLTVLILYIVIQNIESYIITPSVMHRQVKLLPALTITAQFVFTFIFGAIGLILALPLSVVLQVMVKEVLIEDILEKNNS